MTAGRARSIAVVAGLAIVGGATAARGDTPGRVPADAITWTAPAECGDVAALRARMGSYVDGPVAAGWSATVTITAVGAEYHGAAHIGRAPREVTRTVVGRDCAEVIDALALVLGMSAQMAAPAPPPDPPPPPRIAPPPSTTIRARAGLAGDLGTVPRGDGGAGGQLIAARGPWSARLGVAWLPSRFAGIASTTAGIEVGLVVGQVGGCRRGPGAVWFCLGGEVGAMSGAPVHLSGASSVRRAWAAAGLSAARAVELTGRVALVGEVGVIAAIVRPRFILDDGTEVFAPGQVAARASLAIEIRLR
jgi:hypothetical protein